MLRSFNLREYNCWDFLREGWKLTTGRDLDIPNLSSYSVEEMNGVVRDWDGVRYRELEAPRSPCVVLFLAPRVIPHVGLFWRGKVAHLLESGPRYQPVSIAALSFREVRYYEPCLPS
jgi:hypothetical protein